VVHTELAFICLLRISVAALSWAGTAADETQLNRLESAGSKRLRYTILAYAVTRLTVVVRSELEGDRDRRWAGSAERHESWELCKKLMRSTKVSLTISFPSTGHGYYTLVSVLKQRSSRERRQGRIPDVVLKAMSITDTARIRISNDGKASNQRYRCDYIAAMSALPLDGKLERDKSGQAS